jgi:hypothetical protein
MLCRACQQRIPPPRPKPAERRKKGKGRSLDQLCAECGQLLQAEDMVKRVEHKQSQLERFGMSGGHGALLEQGKREEN